MNNNFCKSIADAVSSRDVIIYGAGNLGATLLNIMDVLGKKVLFFLDKNPDKQKNGFCGYKVKAPEEVLYEDFDKVIIVVAVGAKKEAGDILSGLGLEEGVEYIHGTTMRYKTCDAVDTLLGYSRLSDINGFRYMIKGDNSKNKNIICLGGSTTDYSVFGIKSWPEFLAELLKINNINLNILNGGVIGYNSSQELLKLIRDGLEVKPSLVISYSGVNDMGSIPTMGTKYLSDVWDNLAINNEPTSITFSEQLTISHGTKSKMDSAEYWYRNELMMWSICCGFSIPFLGILQPSTYTKNNKSRSLYEQRTFGETANRKYIEEQFAKAKQLVKKGDVKNIVDFTALFDQYENVYIDNCHVFEEGNKIIAEAIYQTIKEKHLLDI